MKPALAAVAALLLCACPTETPRAGYQLQCQSYSGAAPGANEGPPAPAPDADCPPGMACWENCCVRPGETPTCGALVGHGGGPSGVGVGCGAGCDSGDCADSCSVGRCFGEQQYGLPGGSCTWAHQEGGSNCPGGFRPIAPGTEPNGLCLQSCNWRNCRPGWRCACEQTHCLCVPDCGSAPDLCGPGRKLKGERCNPASGRCFIASDCVGANQACTTTEDCCAGNVCEDLLGRGTPTCQPCAACDKACCSSERSCRDGACCGELGQTCRTNADCCPGRACHLFAVDEPGWCVECIACGKDCCPEDQRACVAEACCTVERAFCRQHSECCPGFYCCGDKCGSESCL